MERDVAEKDSISRFAIIFPLIFAINSFRTSFSLTI